MRKREIGEKVMQMLKCLLASYIVTGLLLLGLTFLVYKFELDESAVLGSVVAIYVVSTFVGGFIIGKLIPKRKFLWGMILGLVYFALLLLISYGVYRDFNTNGLNVITTVLLCVGGGMLGGMLA